MKELIVLGLTLCLVAASSNSRLDTSNIEISHYDIYIRTIDETTNVFLGTATIKINIKKVDKITLHKEKLTLGTITLDSDQCVEESDDADAETATISCDKATEGEHTLSIEYTGPISTEDMDGFYVSKYEENNVTKTLYATQFEPIYARRLFPCFDEPELKTTFQITVNHDPKYTALSNTPVESSKLLKTTKQTKFEKTPIMSSYLIALVIAEFESTASKNDQYTVWSRPEAKKYTGTAVDNVDKLIDKLGEFIGIKYEELGLKKCALVGIPDFAAGAMENWGLITYRESDLLDEGDKTTAAGKQKVITVIAHELAHQWFGDYATLEWWGETWLNEGFATYFEYHISDLLQDDFDLDKQFLINVVQLVLIPDSVPSVQALVTNDDDVNTLAEINDKFGDISYDKGGSILRMIRYVLGDDAFKAALKTYLSDHPNSVVDHNDLIKALGEEKFRKWFEQPGYPLVTVSLEGNSLVLEQSDYTTNTSQLWDIPVKYVTSKTPTKPSEVNWISKAEKNSIDVDKESKWVIVNWEQGGYYRVNYETKLFDTILDVLYSDPTQINELNRAQLIDDTFNLAITGQTTYQQAFSLIKYLHNETAYAPWAATINVITALLQKIGDENIVTGIQQMVLQEMESVITIPANVTDLPFESHIETIKGVIILKAACTFGHSSCGAFAKTVFESYLKDKGIDNNYRGFGLCTAIQNSDKQEEDWNKLWDAYGEAETSHEKDDILAALGCASDKTVLQGYLLKSIDENSGIRKQDANSVFKNVLKGGPVGVQAALEFMTKNIDGIQTYYKGLSAVGDMVTGIAKLLVNEADVKQLKDFIETYKDVPEIKVVASEANEIVDSNVKWIKEKLTQLQKLFPGPAEPTPTPGAANTISYTLGLLVVAVLFVFDL